MKSTIHFLFTFIFLFAFTSQVFADTPPSTAPTPAGTTSTPSFTASPSATPTRSPSPTPTRSPSPIPTSNHVSQCTFLKITEGNNAKVPATVKFEAQGSDNLGGISTYHFYFGDGEKAEVMTNVASHTYNTSGTYNARVYIRDTKGNLVTSSACETKVTLQANVVESHRSGCSNLFFEAGNNQKAPSTLKVRVEGFDNKGNIQKYKVDFGNGNVKEQTTKEFDFNYSTPGTYPVKAYVLDSQGNWKGGDSSCQQNASILTESLKEQPKTGVPIVLALGMGGMGTVGAVMQFFNKKK